MKITAKTTLSKILKTKKGQKVLMENSVPCMGCPFAAMEMDKLEIGQVCEAYGLDIKKILKELSK